MKCAFCGSNNSEGLAFCEECGKPLQSQNPEKLEEGVQKCPKCMSEIKPGVKFCQNCGYRVEFLEPISTPNPKTHKKDRRVRKKKDPNRKSFIRSNPYRAILLLLLLIVIGLGALFTWDMSRHSVNFYQADSMATGVVKAFFPYLSDVQPRKDEFKKNGQDVVSYNYLSQMDVALPDGTKAKTTAGVIININRTTGAIEIIQLP